MASNSILKEMWRVKNELSAQADGDIDRLCEQTRDWASKHKHSGPVAHKLSDLTKLFEQTPQSSSLSVGEKTSKYGRPKEKNQ